MMRIAIAAIAIIASLFMLKDVTSSICGPSIDAVLDYETTIVATDGTPQRGIKVTCSGDERALAISDEFGKVAFSFQTKIPAGCASKCRILNFVKETDTSFEAWEIAIPFWKTTTIRDTRTVLAQPFQKGERKNGQFEGEWKEWCLSEKWGSKNGKLHLSGHYINNLKDGEWTEWYCDGGKKSSGKYVNGRKDGVWTEWHSNGNIKSHIEYYNDKREGVWMLWYPTGQIQSEMKFHDDKPYGISTNYSIEGNKSLHYDTNDPVANKELLELIEKSKPPQNAALIVLTPDKTVLSDDEKDKIVITITVKDKNGMPLSKQDLMFDLPFELFTATGPFAAVIENFTDNNGQSKLKIWRLSHEPVKAQAFSIRIKSGKAISDPITIKYTPKIK